MAVCKGLIFVLLLFYFQTATAFFTSEFVEKTRLGFGLQAGLNWLETDNSNGKSSLALGFDASLGLKYGKWIPAVFTSGRFSQVEGSNFSVSDVEFSGTLSNRLITYGLESRWEWDYDEKEKQYFLFRFLFGTSDFEVNQNDVQSGQFGENDDVFLRGNGISLGYGRTVNRRFFIHALFQWVSYNRGVIIERKNDVNDTLFLGDLEKRLDEFSFLVSIGIHDLFS